MNILHLTLKKKWFDMILSGEKKEEYREVKPYWIQRLLTNNAPDFAPKKFDAVKFTNGYSKNSRTFMIELKSINIDEGKWEWGADGSMCFVLSLGNVIEPLVNHI